MLRRERKLDSRCIMAFSFVFFHDCHLIPGGSQDRLIAFFVRDTGGLIFGNLSHVYRVMFMGTLLR